MNLKYFITALFMCMLYSIVAGQYNALDRSGFPGMANSSSSKYYPEVITGDTVRYTYLYEDHGNVSSFLTEYMRNNVWEFYSGSYYMYTNDGDPLIARNSLYINGAWKDLDQIHYYYDQNNRLEYSFYETWSDSLNTWESVSKTTYYYDESGNQNISITQRWDNGSLINSAMTTSTFDGMHRLTSYLTQFWNNGWTNGIIRNYSYFSTTDKLASYEYANWLNNEWRYLSRNTWEYDPQGILLNNTSYSWTSNTWKPSYKSTLNYNSQGAVVSVLTQKMVSDQWVDYSKVEYQHDLYGNSALGRYFLWSNGSWNSTSGKFSMFYNKSENSHSISGTVATATYQYITGINEYEGSGPNSFSLSQNYPNPFNPATNIPYSIKSAGNVKLTVFDALGKQIAVLLNEEKLPGSYTVNFNAAGIPSGIYFYTLECNGTILTRKMILLK